MKTLKTYALIPNERDAEYDLKAGINTEGVNSVYVIFINLFESLTI